MNDHQLPDRSAASKDFYEALDQLKNLLESHDSEEPSSQNSPEALGESTTNKQEKAQELNWEEVAADLGDLSD